MFHNEGSPQDPKELAFAHNREHESHGIEIVSLDSWFPLFLPDRTAQHHDPEGDYPEIARYTSQVMLDTGGLMPQMPLEMATWGVWKTKGVAIAPFEPEAGYQIDRDDLSTVSRQKKLQELLDTEELKTHPLMLVAHGATERMEQLGITLGNDDYYFRPDIWPIVRALRLQVDFPSGIRLESRPNRWVLRRGEMLFDRFYPSDTGAMTPTILMRDFHGDGVQLALPGNLHDLEQIHGRFTIEPGTEVETSHG